MKIHQPTAATTLLAKLLTDFTSKLNLHTNMSPAQIIGCAEALVNTREFNILHLEDYPVFFDRCLAGEYGPIEYSIDQLKICVMLRKFIVDWNAQQAVNREAISNNNVYEIFQHPQMKQILHEVTDKLDVKAKPTEHLKIRELTREEKMIQDWMKDFDRFYTETTDDKSNPTRMIYYEGGWLDQQQYLLLKAKEYEESNQNQE